jgi:cell division protein FtsB
MSEENHEEYAKLIQENSAEELEVEKLNSNGKEGRKGGLCRRMKLSEIL